MTPDELFAAYRRAGELGEQAAQDARRYADARCVALLQLAEQGESLSQIAARIGVTRARVQQMTARGRRIADLAVAEGKTRKANPPIRDDVEFAAVLAKVNAGCDELEHR